MLIEVTQHDIINGRRGSRSHCPVALALNRCTGLEWKVEEEMIYPKNSPKFLTTDDQVFQFICDFDNNIHVDPFSFELNLD